MHKSKKIAKPPPTERGAKLKARRTLRNEKDWVAPSDNDDAPTRTDNKKKCVTKWRRSFTFFFGCREGMPKEAEHRFSARFSGGSETDGKRDDGRSLFCVRYRGRKKALCRQSEAMRLCERKNKKCFWGESDEKRFFYERWKGHFVMSLRGTWCRANRSKSEPLRRVRAGNGCYRASRWGERKKIQIKFQIKS